MKELRSPKDSLLLLFKNIIAMFGGTNYPNLNLAYQFIFTDIDEGFPVNLSFENGKGAFHEGYGEHSDIVIRTTSGVWLEISGGLKNPLWALITRKLNVQGPLSRLRLLPRLLSKRIAAPRSQTFPRRWSRPGRALVLAGSPRKKNGLTEFYLAPFLEGMRKAGTEIEAVHLYEKKIGPCLGCFKCWTATPGVCVQRDDQAELLLKLNNAELIVYAMPLYFHSLPGLVKNHFDRQLPLYHPYLEKAGGLTRHPRRVSVKKSVVLFSICGFPEVRQFEPLVKTLQCYAQESNASLAATVLLPGAMELYYNPCKRSLLTAKLDLLRDAGRQLAGRGKVSRNTVRAISKVAGMRSFIDNGNRYWDIETAAARSSAQ